MAEDTFGYERFLQMGISAPLAGLMIFILMWYFFRNLRLVISPMIVAMTTVIVTMGLLIGMGFTVHIMSSMIPSRSPVASTAFSCITTAAGGGS